MTEERRPPASVLCAGAHAVVGKGCQEFSAAAYAARALWSEGSRARAREGGELTLAHAIAVRAEQHCTEQLRRIRCLAFAHAAVAGVPERDLKLGGLFEGLRAEAESRGFGQASPPGGLHPGCAKGARPNDGRLGALSAGRGGG